MRCQNCGTENSDRNLNCSNCGAELLSTTNVKKILGNKKLLALLITIIFAIIIAFAVLISSVIVPNQAAKKMEKAFESKSSENVIAVFTQYCGDYSVVYDDLSKSGKAVFLEFEDCVEKAKNDMNNQPVETDINNYLLESMGDIILPQEYSAITTIGEYNGELNTIVMDYYDLYSSKISYIEGNELFNSNDFSGAISSFSNVIEGDSWYEDAQKKLTESQTKLLEEKIALIEKYINDGDYDSAQDEINSLRGENLTDEMNKKLDEYETKIYEARLAEIDKFVKDGDLEGAKKYIESLGDGLSDEAQERLNQAIKNKANDYMAKADEALKSGERQGAYDMAVMAQNLCPDDDEINKKVEYYKDYLPFKLYNKKNCISAKEYETFDYGHKATANDSTTMLNCVYVVYARNSSSLIGEATYNLSKKYNKITGTGFLLEDLKNSDQSGYFEIFGDGKKLYTSDNFKMNYLPKEFSVDVTGVDILFVKYYGITKDAGSYGISNFVATKNLPK